MVALADEIFLDFEWSGRQEWNNHLLEEEVFHSQGAGELLFRRLDDLLVQSGPGYVDLAKVYLMALALGFKGKYRVGDPEKKIQTYLNRLYSYIFKRDPDARDAQQRLFPQTYEATLAKGDPRWLPTTRRWKITLAVILIGGLLITHGLWSFLIGPMDQVIDNIMVFNNK